MQLIIRDLIYRSPLNHDEGSASILPRHIGETPDVTQADSRTGCSKDDTYFGSEISTFCHTNILEGTQLMQENS